MSNACIIERLIEARSDVERVCGWLASPAPERLDRCSATLTQAVTGLSVGAGWLGSARGDAEALAEAWRLARTVRRASRLLESANEYYAGWNRIRAAMVDGYEPGGQVPAPIASGTISLEG